MQTRPARALSIAVAVAATAAAVDGQSPFRSFDPRYLDFLDCSALADFDGDGDVDAWGETGGVGLNAGDGVAFTVAFFNGGATLPRPGVVGDWNADGFPDYVSDDDVFVRQPASPGFLFAAAPTLVLPPAVGGTREIVSLTKGDFDLDGDFDLVCGTTSTTSAGVQTGPTYLFLNNGAGVFFPAPLGAMPATPRAAGRLFARDFDLDGDLDVLCVNAPLGVAAFGPTSGATLLVNTGGVFVATALPAPFNTGAPMAAVGDFDGDGRPDLAAATNGLGFAVSMNSATGFGAAVFSANPVPAQLSVGSLAFSPSTAPSDAIAAAAVDVDGDGNDELLLQRHMGGLEVRDVAANGAIGPVGWSGPNLRAASRAFAFYAPYEFDAEALQDLDGDGDRDLVVRTATRGVLPALNDGAGGFVVFGDDGVESMNRPAFVDLDLDGDLDAAEVGTPGAGSAAPAAGTSAAYTAINVGGGRFVPGPTTVGLPPATSLGLDADADGDGDLYGLRPYLGPTPPPNDVAYVNAGGGSFVAATLPWSTWPASSAVVFDADQDGDADLLVGRRYPVPGAAPIPTPTLLLRQSGGALTAPVAIGAHRSTLDVALGDFDGDGLLDLLQVNQAFGAPETTIVYLDVAGAATPIAQSGFPAGYAAVGDLDFDGDSDAIVGNLILQSAGGVLTPVATVPQGLPGPSVLVDVDGDGDLDLVNEFLGVMPNLGIAGFGPSSPADLGFPTPSGEYRGRPTLVDVDQDGDVDTFGYGPRTFFNVTRHLAHPAPVRVGYATSVDAYGSAGSTALLFAAPNPANFAVSPTLRVLIDPATAQFVAAVPLGAAGSTTPGFASLPVFVPNVPALVGLSLHWQAIETTQGRFTNRLTSTVLSF